MRLVYTVSTQDNRWNPRFTKEFSMNRALMFMAVLAALMLSSCSQSQTGTTPESASQHATVIMRDGTKTAGTVVKSSNEEITITGDDSITRTIPMNQVRSIEYDDVSPAAGVEEKTASPATRTQPAASSRAAPRQTYDVPAGTEIAVRTDEEIDSASAAEGQTYAGIVTRDVPDADGDVAIPRGSTARIVILSASQGGRIRGASDLVLDLKHVIIGGRRYAVETEEISKRGREGIGANKRTAEFTGGGAALGAIVGAIAGGGKGAAIGAASGAGAGALTQILTKGRSIRVPAETILTFRLDAPLRVTAER
jgi:outer membrane lipoprotein SlyB